MLDIQSFSFSHFTNSNVNEPYYLSLCLLSALGVKVPVLDLPLPHGFVLTLKIQITFLLLQLQSILLHIQYLGLIKEKSFLLQYNTFHISPLNVMDAADILRHNFTFWLCYFWTIFLVDLRETSRWCVSFCEIMLIRWNKLLRLVYLDVIGFVSVNWTLLLHVPHSLALIIS